MIFISHSTCLFDNQTNSPTTDLRGSRGVTAAMTNALGIAGSLCGGLLEFARGDGGMVKRLHLGRASEAGGLAASLAADRFEGPRTVLEGEFGFLKVFCTKWDEALLIRGLGEEFLLSTTVLKRYPCHATAHAVFRAFWSAQRSNKNLRLEWRRWSSSGTTSCSSRLRPKNGYSLIVSRLFVVVNVVVSHLFSTISNINDTELFRKNLTV
jgi:MmgE/PrpD N-terminal domain